jgi:protein CpxP
MTASRTVLALAAVAALGAGLDVSPPVLAQSGSSRSATPPAANSGPITQTPSTRAPSDDSRSDTRVEERIAQLHKQLKITKDQESDWNTLARDMRENAQRMSSLL